MSGKATWPECLWIVRHGESAGNVARVEAEAAGLAEIALETRDVDVPLSALGEQQAAALGRWFGALPEAERPTVALASPYLRACATATKLLDAAGLDHLKLHLDERMREREFGILDRLTKRGIAAQFPDQARLRTVLGKFYHRPPGGESWCDVILRLRSVLDTLTREHRGERVLIVCHSVVVLCFRYLLEGMTEGQILTIDRDEDVANCSVTFYQRDSTSTDPVPMALRLSNFVAPLEAAGQPITAEPDVPVGAK